MFAWIQSILSGLLETLGFVEKEADIVILGLDNAGKTTLQHKLKTGKLSTFLPTHRAKEETISIGGVKIRAWDLGGHMSARRLWKQYYSAADGIVFMLDSADSTRLGEAATELSNLLRDEAIDAAIPVAVFANKSDVKGSLTLHQISEALQLDTIAITHPRKVELFAVSVWEGTGYPEGFRWLSSFL